MPIEFDSCHPQYETQNKRTAISLQYCNAKFESLAVAKMYGS